MQLDLALINRDVNETKINQRLVDGYINATALCKAAGKNIADYVRLHSTKEYIEELSSETGIPTSALFQSVKGGIPEYQGTWIHPQIAIHLAQWASAKFAVLISKWVFEWMGGNIPNANRLPYHLQRYLINRAEIPPTHFSIFNEIVYNLIAPLEDRGYELPDAMVPDISEGRMFAKWVRKVKGLEPNDFPTYTHTYPDGRSIPNVKLYPNLLLSELRDHFYNVWIREKASKYFLDRDQNAIHYLKEMIKTLPAPEKQNIVEQTNKTKLSEFNKSIQQALLFDWKKEDDS